MVTHKVLASRTPQAFCHKIALHLNSAAGTASETDLGGRSVEHGATITPEVGDVN